MASPRPPKKALLRMTVDRDATANRFRRMDGMRQMCRCRACRFPLPRLAQGRCPECGLEFDLADESSFVSDADVAHQRRLRWRLGLAIALVVCAGAACLGGFWLYLLWKAQDMSW